MIEKVNRKRLDRTITYQHQRVFMFHICIRSLLTNKKNEKKSLHIFNLLLHQTQVLRRETERTIA